MIAKLIVQSSDRTAALHKLKAALDAYEIAGPITNIEFLKRMCLSPAFVAGDVETGYIDKHRDELFEKVEVPDETWIQAALGLYLAEQKPVHPNILQPYQAVGFGTGFTQPRKFELLETPSDPSAKTTPVSISVQQVGPHTFSVVVGSQKPSDVTSKFDVSTNVIQTFFPHTRLETTFVQDPSTNKLVLFQHGRQHRLQLAIPKWEEKALGTKDITNSVLAPMPCKILRVEVEEGADVKKNQPLVIIESMKMETVIRSPQDGVVKRVVHRAGDLCKAGTALVEFEEEKMS